MTSSVRSIILTFTLDVHDLDPVSLLIRDGMISLMKSHAAKYNVVESTDFPIVLLLLITIFSVKVCFCNLSSQ